MQGHKFWHKNQLHFLLCYSPGPVQNALCYKLTQVTLSPHEPLEERKGERKCSFLPKIALYGDVLKKEISLASPSCCVSFLLFNRSVKQLSGVLHLWRMRINWRIRATCTLYPVLTYNMALGSAVLFPLTADCVCVCVCVCMCVCVLDYEKKNERGWSLVSACICHLAVFALLACNFPHHTCRNEMSGQDWKQPQCQTFL